MHSVLKLHAHTSLKRGIKALYALRQDSAALHSRIRAFVWDLEHRLSLAGVPQCAVHPALQSPLCVKGFIAPSAFYGELSSLHQAVRSLTHPSAWSSTHPGLWDAVATSAGHTMKATLVLVLSTLLPLEARLSYLALRHSAYASPTVSTLGDMIVRIVGGMMTSRELGRQHQPRVAKALRQAGPTLEPYSLYILRSCCRSRERTLGQAAAERTCLEHSLATFFAQAGDGVLYSSESWAVWLMEQEESHLVALYIKYLQDGFQ